MDYKLHGSELAIALVVLFHALVLLITILRYILDHRSKKLLQKKASDLSRFILSERAKYKVINVFRWRSTMMSLGFCFSLFAVLLIFNVCSKKTFQEDNIEISWENDFNIIEQKIHRIKVPIVEIPEKKIKQPEVKAVVPTVFKIKTVMQTNTVEAKSIIREPSFESKIVQLVPEKPQKDLPKPQKLKPYTIVEEMPLFPNTAIHSESQQALLKYVYKNVKYPSIARENNADGRVIVRFVIDELGWIESIQLLEDPGFGMGDSVREVLLSMRDKDLQWRPGRQGGNLVKVAFTLPVQFHLN